MSSQGLFSQQSLLENTSLIFNFFIYTFLAAKEDNPQVFPLSMYYIYYKLKCSMSNDKEFLLLIQMEKNSTPYLIVSLQGKE